MSIAVNITPSDETETFMNILRTGPNSIHVALGCHDWKTTSGIKSKVESTTAAGYDVSNTNLCSDRFKRMSKLYGNGRY